MRFIGVDVHRDFCEVALVDDGRLRSAGQVLTTPAALKLFACSLAADDVVAMEATANAWRSLGSSSRMSDGWCWLIPRRSRG